MLVLLGSQALAHYTTLNRVPADLDVLGDYDEIISRYKTVDTRACYPINSGKKIVLKQKDLIVEGEITWPGSLSEELYRYILSQNSTSTDSNGILIPDLNILYMLKMSHRYLKNSPHFLKTMEDIHLMRTLGAGIPQEYVSLFKRREKETYTYTHPSLKQSKGTFFNGDGITYIYDHDSIHEAVAIGLDPAYRSYQKDGEEVACDKAKWDQLPERKKLDGVLEECYVLAIERSQVPYKGSIAPRQSFLMALSKVCTSITSGWFREYAWENYYQAVEAYDDTYADRFWRKVRLGMVKPYVA